MKKLVISLGLIFGILTCIIISTSYLDSMISDMDALVEKAQEEMEEKNYASAADTLQEALDIWHENDSFTSVFISHDEIEQLSDAFYEALRDIKGEFFKAFKVSSVKLREHISALGEMEHLSLSSLF